MRNKSKVLASLLTIALSYLIGFISIYYLKEYGWTVFVFIPFLIGFLPPAFLGFYEKTSGKEAYRLSFITLGIALFFLLVFAIEGMICIVMASPILGLLTWLGAFVSVQTNKNIKNNAPLILIGISVLSIGSMSFDSMNVQGDLIPVKTKIAIKAPINEVWKNVVTFNKIGEPTDWIFSTGISYPTGATIKGSGVGAIRYCNFTTGSFVEPITAWDEPNLLQFDVIQQPIPMNEYNPFWNIHPPHLDGYFQSHKGQFKLTELNDSTTSLEGTTWYKVDITPEFYWKTWSDLVIHRIHNRVLTHIKNESEKI